MMTKAERAELERLRSFRRMFWWAYFFVCVAAIGTTILWEIKSRQIEAQWETHTILPSEPVTPTPQDQNTPEFKWPTTPWIEALMGSIITPARAARTTVEDEVAYFDVKSKSKLWTVQQRSTPSSHLGCVATRNISNVTRVLVYAPAKGDVQLTLEGVDFKFMDDRIYAEALVSVDGDVAYMTSATRLNQWNTVIDLPQLTLRKLGSGSTLRITINGLYFEFDLTDSAKAAAAVEACNLSGQANTFKRRIAAAVPATTRG